MLGRGVGSDQHKMINFSRRVSKPDQDMHGTGPVCGHETVSGPAGGGDLGSGRLVTKVGGCGGSHTDYILLEQRVDQHFLPRNHPTRRITRCRDGPLRRACPVIPCPNPLKTHPYLSGDRCHGHALIAQIQNVLGFHVVPARTPGTERHTRAVQPIPDRAVVYPKLCTDPAERPTGGIELGRSVHIHDQYPNFRRKPPTSSRDHCSGFPVQRYKRN